MTKLIFSSTVVSDTSFKTMIIIILEKFWDLYRNLEKNADALHRTEVSEDLSSQIKLIKN